MSAIKDYNKEELSNLILEQKLSYELIGKIYGVSGNAIKKKAIRMGIQVPLRRTINPKENFSHPRRKNNSYVNKVSDEHFINVITTSNTWNEIGLKLGYKSKGIANNVKDAIIERCKKLNIKCNVGLKILTILNLTKRELFAKRSNWLSARNTIRKLAYDIYYENNNTYECAICGYKHHIDVAHIKEVSDFDDNSTLREINDINNLIGLCPNHHWEYDHGILTLEQIKQAKLLTKMQILHIIDEDK